MKKYEFPTKVKKSRLMDSHIIYNYGQIGVINQIKRLRRKNLKRRNIEIINPRHKIVTLVGPRRAGKTYALLQFAYKLLKKYGEKRVFYLNLEGESVNDLTNEYIKTIEDFITKIDKNKTGFVFLDEVQNLENWEKFLARIHAQYPNIKLYVTGSNSRLLSSDISTVLRGRTLTQEIFTLDFTDFLNFQDDSRQSLQDLFMKFLSFGGFPEVVLEENDKFKLEILKEYYDVLLFRDIIERYDLRSINIPAFKFLVTRIAENISKPTSINKIYNQLVSLGYKVDKNDLYTYLDYLKRAYFVFEVPKYHRASIKREFSQKKYYLVDTGYIQLLKFVDTKDLGKMLENLVFLHLYKNFYEVFYLKNGYECDFVASIKNRTLPIQVSLDLNINNVDREIKGLLKAIDYTGSKKGVMIFGALDEFAKNKLKAQKNIIPISAIDLFSSKSNILIEIVS